MSESGTPRRLKVGICILVAATVLALVYATNRNATTPETETYEETPGLSEQANEYASIPLNEATFPDTMLRGYLSYYYDLDGSGALDNGEAEAIWELGETFFYEDDTYEMKRAEDFPALTSLQGLELLPSLTVLTIKDANSLSEIDLAGFDDLLTLKVFASSDDENSTIPLASIDTSGAPSLRALRIRGANTSRLDLSANSELTDLSWFQFSVDTPLESLTIPSSLERVEFNNARISDFDFSSCMNLEQLFLVGDNIADSIELPDSNNLRTLFVSAENLSQLDLKSQTSLTGLYLSAPKIANLDLASQTNLKYLNLSNTSITSIDLQGSAYVNESIVVSEECTVNNTSGGVLKDDFEWPGAAYLPDDALFESHIYWNESTK